MISARLDGYGIGEPWNCDKIYNGAVDNAARVDTLLDFAQKLHSAKKTFKRPVLFAVWTGEEKGLVALLRLPPHHSAIAVRGQREPRSTPPIFPLKTLTTLAVDDQPWDPAAAAKFDDFLRQAR